MSLLRSLYCECSCFRRITLLRSEEQNTSTAEFGWKVPSIKSSFPEVVSKSAITQVKCRAYGAYTVSVLVLEGFRSYGAKHKILPQLSSPGKSPQ
jgi:hypothetical protein